MFNDYELLGSRCYPFLSKSNERKAKRDALKFYNEVKDSFMKNELDFF